MRTNPSDIALIFDAELGDAAELEELAPRYNVAPTQPITVVLQRGDEGRFVELHRWGLVPSWANSPAAGARMINARAESIATSSAFRASFLRRRCIIPADGFYEWRREGKAKQPYLIHRRDDRPLAFAGIWAPWRDPSSGDWLLSAAVVTTASNATVGELHNRMPAILTDEEWPLWLDPMVADPALLRDLLHPADDALLRLDAASQLVNNANNEGPELLTAPPKTEPALRLFG